MSKKITTEDFVLRSREIHGGQYDYSKVEYKKNSIKVCIICPIHGEFWQTPACHYTHGCPKCGIGKQKVGIYGIAVNDLDIPTREKGTRTKSYVAWRSMIDRCYGEKRKKSSPTYRNCSVCDEWLTFSNFKKWFDEHYVEGWQLDKDIISKGNRVYSPEKCCFVPPEINYLFLRRQNHRGKYPIGVRLENGKKFLAFITKFGTPTYLGRYNTMEDAFMTYKNAKEAYIKEVADKWKGKLDPRVYKAMYEYQVEITD